MGEGIGNHRDAKEHEPLGSRIVETIAKDSRAFGQLAGVDRSSWIPLLGVVKPTVAKESRAFGRTVSNLEWSS
jgi:hypothetical protein